MVPLELGTMIARLNAGDFDLALLQLPGDDRAERAAASFSTAASFRRPGANRGRVRDAALDALLDEGDRASGLEARRAIYARVEARERDAMHWLPLWYEDQVVVTSARARAFSPSARGALALAGAHPLKFQGRVSTLPQNGSKSPPRRCAPSVLIRGEVGPSAVGARPLPAHPNRILCQPGRRRTPMSRKPTKYVFVTGGVVSSIGKGLASASIGALLEARGLRVTHVKLDPYINVDPGHDEPVPARRGLRHRRRRRDRPRPRPLRALHHARG